MSDFSHRTGALPTAAGASADTVHVRAHVPPPCGTLA